MPYKNREKRRAKGREYDVKRRAKPEIRKKMREYDVKRYADNPEKARARNAEYRATPEGRARGLINSAKHRAKKKGLPFDLNDHEQDIVGILCNGGCFYSGLPFNLTGGHTWDSPSLDQVEAGAGYTWTNTRVVIDQLNRAKHFHTLDQLVFVAQKLVDYQSAKKAYSTRQETTDDQNTP